MPAARRPTPSTRPSIADAFQVSTRNNAVAIPHQSVQISTSFIVPAYCHQRQPPLPTGRGRYLPTPTGRGTADRGTAGLAGQEQPADDGQRVDEVTEALGGSQAEHQGEADREAPGGGAGRRGRAPHE